MAHDYAKKPRAKPAAKKTTPSTSARGRKAPPAKATVPGWVWLFVGTAMGAFVMFLVRLAEVDVTQAAKAPSQQAPTNKPPEEPVKRTATTQTQKAPQAAKPAPKAEAKVEAKAAVKVPAAEQKPRFDFYHMLKENEVPVGAAGGQPAVSEQPLQRTFILQVASFKTPQDAEQLKVELILMNLQAKTEEVTVRNGEVWHRVLVGPFDSRSQLAKARSTLISNGHQALVLEYKPKASQAN